MNPILDYKELLAATQLSEWDILAQIRDEYDRGKSFVEKYRDQFKEDLRLYQNEKAKKDKIGDTTMYNVMSALMARTYIDKPQAKFQATRLGVDDVVDNLNAALKEDFESEEMAVTKYYSRWDAFFYGAAITARSGWDGVEKKNIFETVDPRTWIPDPTGDYGRNEFSYTGFERLVYESNITDSQFFDYEGIFMKDYDGLADEAREDSHISANLSTTESDAIYNPQSEIYYHMGTFNGHKCLIVTAEDRTRIIKAKLIPAVTKEEKKDKNLIPFPITITNFVPGRNAPFGLTRVPDLTRDPQKVQSVMANLRLNKSKAELYPMYLYNTKLIKNRSDLDFGFNKMIGVNPLDGENINNSITPMQKDFRADNSFLVEQSVEKTVEMSTGIGKVIQGSEPDRRETLGTNQLIQGNTDILLQYYGRIQSWGEKDLVKSWFRGYMENFQEGDKKLVNITLGAKIVPVQLTKKQFLQEDTIKITVQSTSQIEQERRKQQVAYNASLGLLQSFERPQASQNFTARRVLLANGVPEEHVDIEVPMTPQEMIAVQENNDMLNNIFVGIDPSDDDMTHLIVHKGSGNSPQSIAHRMAHVQAAINKGLNPEAPVEGGGTQGTAKNAMLSSALAQTSSDSAQQSRSDVTNVITPNL